MDADPARNLSCIQCFGVRYGPLITEGVLFRAAHNYNTIVQAKNKLDYCLIKVECKKIDFLKSTGLKQGIKHEPPTTIPGSS